MTDLDSILDIVYVLGLMISSLLFLVFAVLPQVRRYLDAEENRQYEARFLIREVIEAGLVSILWPLALIAIPFYGIYRVVKDAYF